MKFVVAFAAVAVAAFAEEPKTLPNQAGSDNVDIVGTALVDRKEIQQALGADLEAGFIVVRIKITPRAGYSMNIDADHFTLISRKDGERSGALSPTQIAGSSALVVSQGQRVGGGGIGTRTSTVGGRGPNGGGGLGNTGSTQGGEANARVEATKKDTSLLAALESKALPERETKAPVEGLLYFVMEGKVKPKDLGLVYKSPLGRLEMDFK